MKRRCHKKKVGKLIGDRRLRILFYIYRSLIVIIILLCLIIIGGTIYGVFSNSTPPGSVQVDELQNNKGQTFTGIGPLRVPTVDPQPGMVIIYVAFTYFPQDKSFSEELVLRVRDFREIIMGYIGSFSVTDLQKQGEDLIKAELLRRFNAILRLGQIETLYFSDFMIVG